MVDVLGAYSPPAAAGRNQPFVRCNMISTIDGAITLEGRSGLLGGPADRRVFQTLRSWADVVLVGAGTVRTEGYGPVRLEEDLREQREARGCTPVPPIATVTRSGNLDWTAPFFTEAEQRPIVFTTDDAHRPGHGGEQVADVVVAGHDRVDIRLVIDHLFSAGFRSILLEGGPAINAQVVHAQLLDELCLTFAPRLVAGSGPRVLAGPEIMPPLDVDLVHILEEDGFLFYRLAVRRLGGGPDPVRQDQ